MKIFFYLKVFGGGGGNLFSFREKLEKLNQIFLFGELP